MNRVTLLAILQQSEYDPTYFNRWWRHHHTDQITLQPKKWTAKLRLIDQLSKLLFWLPAHQQILTATWFLSPVDWVIKSSILLAAQLKLRNLKRRGMKVVAIAGSYGKTSTKKITQHVLQAQTSTQATPKSINTPLGIARFILKELDPRTKVFLVELGEYYPGDVARLAQFVEPEYGIVCPVGRQHLERMQQVATIAQTIMELAAYLHFHPGKVILHESLVPFLPTGLTQPPLTYGQLPASDYAVLQGSVSWAGTEAQLQLTHQAQPVQAYTPLFGIHQLENSLPVLWLTQALGLDQLAAVRQLGTTPHVPHRHQPLFIQNNVLLLDNGYNSNPDSAPQSLALLKSLPATRRIVITPGFAELGQESDALHHQFGKQLASVVDYLGLIDSQGSSAIKEGFIAAGGSEDQIVTGHNQTEVAERMATLFTPQSIVLFENNLPEVYN